MSEEVPSKWCPPRHDGNDVATFQSYDPPQAFRTLSILTIYVSTMAPSDSPLGGPSANSTSITQGMGRPILRFRHSTFDSRLLVIQGWGNITLFADPQGVAMLQEVTTLALCPIFGSFLSYSLPRITDRLGNERLVVQL